MEQPGLKTIDGQIWLVDQSQNRVLIHDPETVQAQILEHGFQVVFNHYAGISNGNDPLAPEIIFPTRTEGETEAEYARKVLTSIGHPAATADDEEAIFIASVIIERETK